MALSGEGADELFGGYYTYLADKLVRPLRWTPAPLRRAALAALDLWPVSDDKISFEYKLKRFLAGSLAEADLAHLYWNGTFAPEQKRQLCRHGDWPPVERVFTIHCRLRTRPALSTATCGSISWLTCPTTSSTSATA